jgi:hypothetical protein
MKRIFLCLLMLTTISYAYSQSADQVKTFINKGQQAIMKAQKEMLRLSDRSEEISLRKAIRYQAVGVKFYNIGKLKEAADFSFKARTQSIGLLEKYSKISVDYFLLTDEEKGFVSSDYKKLSSDESILTDSESDKIDKLDVLNPQKVREIELTINQ